MFGKGTVPLWPDLGAIPHGCRIEPEGETVIHPLTTPPHQAGCNCGSGCNCGCQNGGACNCGGSCG